jgi:hypothetical protein
MRKPSAILVMAAAIMTAGCGDRPPDRASVCRSQYESGNPAIARYGPNGGAPERIIEGPRTGLCRPGAIAIGPSGEIFVLDQATDGVWESRVLVFDSAALGDVPPVRTMVFAREWGRSRGGLGFDRTGHLYILSAATIPVRGGSIAVYDATMAGSPDLVRVIEGAAGQLERPSSIAFDAEGDFYVTDDIENTGQILVYGEDAKGEPVLRRKISGPETLLRLPIRLAIGPGDSLYVLNAFYQWRPCPSSGPAVGLPNATVTVYAPLADGNVEPIRSLTMTQNGASPGRKYGYVNPRGLDVDTTGSLYVWMSGPESLMFPPASNGLVAPTKIIEAFGQERAEPTGVTRTDAGRTYQVYRPRWGMCR